jgi:nuclear pore complex protein Nup133
MFSPEASVASARSSLRNPRRRQRKDSDGLQQQPRKKRSKLSGDTFHSPTDAPANGNANGNGHVTMNGHASHGAANGALMPMEIPIHEKKAALKRGIKGDTALYLVSASEVDLICFNADKPCFGTDSERELPSQETT